LATLAAPGRKRRMCEQALAMCALSTPRPSPVPKPSVIFEENCNEDPD
jgi:hypothetical protein